MSNYIYDKLRSDVVAGAIDKNGRLPGFRMLASHYNCSRGTVENAVNMLVVEGILQTVHGRGTFIATKQSVTRRNYTKIIGAVLIRYSWMEAMERLRAKYLKKGWFISTYCATDDLQNPESEARFLNQALLQNFAAVILVGSPKTPLNTELYRKMRLAGMKILHLTHYKYDMSGEAAILPDYRAAGRLAVSTAAMKGYRNFVYIGDPESISPSTLMRLEGVHEMVKGLNLKFSDGTAYSLKKLQNSRNVSPDIVLLPDETKAAVKLREILPEANILILSGTDKRAKLFDHISFDYESSIRLAMEYACNEKIKPVTLHQKALAPKFFKANMKAKI